MDLLGMMDINFPSLTKTSAVRVSDFRDHVALRGAEISPAMTLSFRKKYI